MPAVLCAERAWASVRAWHCTCLTLLTPRLQVNGQPRVVRPHPDFRLFLTMDPQFGEISRAMRNRCVEVALPEPDAALLPLPPQPALLSGAAPPLGESAAAARPATLLDVAAMINVAGVPGLVLPVAMARAHTATVAAWRLRRAVDPATMQPLGAQPVGAQPVPRARSAPVLRHLLHWAALASAQARRGVPVLPALWLAMKQVRVCARVFVAVLGVRAREGVLCASVPAVAMIIFGYGAVPKRAARPGALPLKGGSSLPAACDGARARAA